MIKINLRDFYPECYRSDYFVDVPEELAQELIQWKRDEKAYVRQRYRKKAHYSLNREDGIEHEILFIAFSPEEIYERKLTFARLYAALSELPETQRRRICACYIFGLSQATIAKSEGVSRKVVCVSIQRGLKKLEEILKNMC